MPFGNSPARLPVPEGQTAIAQRFVSVYRSADFQSAVSPIWNRPSVGHSQDSGFCGRSAGYKPAIQQTTSLRYGPRHHGKQIQRFIAGFGRAGDMSPGGTKEGSFLHRSLIAVPLSSLRDFAPLGGGPQR